MTISFCSLQAAREAHYSAPSNPPARGKEGTRERERERNQEAALSLFLSANGGEEKFSRGIFPRNQTVSAASSRRDAGLTRV